MKIPITVLVKVRQSDVLNSLGTVEVEVEKTVVLKDEEKLDTRSKLGHDVEVLDLAAALREVADRLEAGHTSANTATEWNE